MPPVPDLGVHGINGETRAESVDPGRRPRAPRGAAIAGGGYARTQPRPRHPAIGVHGARTAPGAHLGGAVARSAEGDGGGGPAQSPVSGAERCLVTGNRGLAPACSRIENASHARMVPLGRPVRQENEPLVAGGPAVGAARRQGPLNPPQAARALDSCSSAQLALPTAPASRP